VRKEKFTTRTLFVFLILGFSVVVSCKTENEFTKAADKVFTSKRYKEAIKERDELCAANKQLRQDTSALIGEKHRLNAEVAALHKKYDDLANTSGAELAKLNSDLKKKEADLQGKETLLKEREQRLREMEATIQRQDSITNALNNIVKNALLGFRPDELTVEMRNGKVYVSMSDKLLFKSGSATVEDKGKEAIKKLAEVLNRNQEVDVLIEGHTDNVPIKTAVYKDNWDLSAARATSVVRLLSEEYKVPAKRLTASGKGEYFPVANNETPEGRAKNRRTEIVLTPKLDELYKLIQKGK
jgi:chemotaxis protein MotB